MTRTKVICTIGPACNTYEKIIGLCKAGMNVARLNFSHGTHEEHLLVIEHLKNARRELKMPLAIMLDTKGPEIRIGKLFEGEIALQKGDLLSLIEAGREPPGPMQIPIHPGSILPLIPIGTQVLFDDGYISSYVVSVDNNIVQVEIDNQGLLLSGKGVNIPNVDLQLPAVTEKDISDICFGCEHDVDVIAASFVRSPEHVMVIKNLLAKQGKPEIQVIAKIENYEGIRNFDSIVLVADGIMIARGDLGVEVPLSEVPRLQKMMIRKSYLAGKPSVTATQMLESMIYHPRPTRAEVSDVANAIYDSTSAVMLSGETAIGRYPFETVNVMKRIIKDAEEDFNYRAFFDNFRNITFVDVPSSVTLATVKTAYSSNAKAIFAFTTGGSTARLVARLRPGIPIIAMTANEKCYHQLAYCWGVVPFLQGGCRTVLDAFRKVSDFALERDLVHLGALVVVTAGVPFGTSGTTNTMMVESIGEGEILIRAGNGFGSAVYGNVKHVFSPELTHTYTVRGQLLVIATCDESYLPLIQESAGVILQNLATDLESENYLLSVAKEYNKPVITRADTAFRVLAEGQLVTVDPEKKLVYKGAVVLRE
ncbi:MAG: pyruvate kinase [Parachlamydiaceae bacterium]|nr:pyruvate kinase [Parachlamydiaceae bacterium]